jgi:hypothetical protein
LLPGYFYEVTWDDFDHLPPFHESLLFVGENADGVVFRTVDLDPANYVPPATIWNWIRTLGDYAGIQDLINKR